MRTLVIGLGNPLLCDDTVGLRVAHELRDRLRRRPEVEIAQDCHGGLRLMERMIGYERAIVVDAIQSGGEPGAIRQVEIDGASSRHSASAHDADLITALKLGRRIGVPLPDGRNIVVIGIEASDVSTFSHECTPQVAAAVPHAVEAVIAALDRGAE